MSYNFKISPRILELLPLAIEQHNLVIVSVFSNTKGCCLISPNADYTLTMAEDKLNNVTCRVSIKGNEALKQIEKPEDICELIYEYTTSYAVKDENLVPFVSHTEQDIEIAAALILKIFNEKVFRSEYAKYISNYIMNSLIYRYILTMSEEGTLNELPDVKEITYVNGKFVVDWATPSFSFLNYASKITFKGVS